MGRWMLVRDVALFLTGLAGLGHEILVTDGERPALLCLLGALLGLPVFLRLDGRPASPPPSPPGPAPAAPAVPEAVPERPAPPG